MPSRGCDTSLLACRGHAQPDGSQNRVSAFSTCSDVVPRNPRHDPSAGARGSGRRWRSGPFRRPAPGPEERRARRELCALLSEVRAPELSRLYEREPRCVQRRYDFVREVPLVNGERRRVVPGETSTDVFMDASLRPRQLVCASMEITHLVEQRLELPLLDRGTLDQPVPTGPRPPRAARCEAPRGGQHRGRTPEAVHENGLNSERMKGLEPSTFCMARTWRELPGADSADIADGSAVPGDVPLPRGACFCGPRLTRNLRDAIGLTPSQRAQRIASIA
jgi:hypothetical protein